MDASRSRIAALAALAALCTPPAAAADCAGPQAALDRAVAARDLAGAKRAEADVFAAGVACIDDRGSARERRAALEVALAADPDGPLRTDAEREAALGDAASPSDSWRASEALADFLVRHRRFAEGAAAYDAGIDRALRFARPTDAEKRELLVRAAAAKALASDDRGGTAAAALAPSLRAVDGTVGGIFSPALRGAVAVAVPLPIQFATSSAALTPAGRDAADELAEALRQQGEAGATLVGHTDPRGPADYNMALSARRLETVRAYLRARGLPFDPVLVPKGLSEPFDLALLPYRPTDEEAWALDRRVEWLRPPATP